MVYIQTFMFSLASAGQMSLQGWKEVSLTFSVFVNNKEIRINVILRMANIICTLESQDCSSPIRPLF